MPTIIRKHEHILIWVKDCDDLTVLPILSAIQSYERDAKRKHEAFCSQRMAKSDFKMVLDLILPSDEFSFLFAKMLSTLQMTMYAYDRILDPTVYDCIFDLSEEKARKIGKSTGKNLAQSYGIMLGGEASSLPDVSNLCTSFTPSDFILMSDLFLDTMPPRFDLSKMSLRIYEDHPLRERIQKVFECIAVIDYPSFESHLASCLGKPVIEVNTDLTLTKWSNPNYYMLTEMNEEALVRGLKLCLPQCLS